MITASGPGQRGTARRSYSFVVKGKYKPDSDRFTAGLKAAFGSYRMSEERRDDGLHVHSERTNGRYSYDTAYQFVPL